MENPFQVLVWPGGGFIGLILWAMSIVLLAVIVQNFIAIRRQNVVPPLVLEQVRELLEKKQYREAMELTETQPDVLSHMIHAALLEAPFGYAAMDKAMVEAADAQTTKMLRYTEWLNLLGNMGPMVGLLGTVWGLILTFFAIVAAGGIPDPGKLAGAIGVKLVCTLLGLCIAIPALGVYGSVRNRLDTLSAEAIIAGKELIAGFRRTGSKKADASQPPVQAS